MRHRLETLPLAAIPKLFIPPSSVSLSAQVFGRRDADTIRALL
jgi:hypothetical protein